MTVWLLSGWFPTKTCRFSQLATLNCFCVSPVICWPKDYIVVPDLYDIGFNFTYATASALFNGKEQ